MIKDELGQKRSAGACENRYYTVLSNPNAKSTQIRNLPVVLTSNGKVTRGRRLTPVVTAKSALPTTAIAMLKKIVSRLSSTERDQLADMLVFGDSI